MTRLMGDATTGNVGALLAAGPWDLVAPYVTGAGIAWTAAQRALFASIPQATIDQGGVGAPVMSATVRDVEPGAWSPAQAVNLAGWTADRPTIYCDRVDLARPGGVLASGWRGDLWLAIPGWQLGDPLPDAPGCTIVAVQNVQGASGAYDSSLVLDPAWPGIGDPPNMAFMVQDASNGAIYLVDGGKTHHVNTPAAVQAYQSIGIQLVQQADAEVAALVADFPPGQPTVTVGNVTFPSYTITGTATPQ